MRLLVKTVLVFFLVIHFIPSAAQNSKEAPRQVLKVGIYVSPPFVMNQSYGVDGMAIELWEHVAKTLI